VDVRLSPSLPWHLGATANSGSGPDEYSVRLAAVSSIDNVMKLFGLMAEGSKGTH